MSVFDSVARSLGSNTVCGYENALERPAALGQVVHAAYGLVPQRDFAGVAVNLVEPVGGNLGVLGQRGARAGIGTRAASRRGTATPLHSTEQGRQDPMFTMTRDGCAFIVGGLGR